MKLDLSADEVLTTTRSVRKRLDFDRPVERAVVEECLEIALQAPTGSNSQGWQFVIVEDAAKKQALADIYARNFAKYASMARSNQYQPGDMRYEQRDRVTESAVHLAENFHRCADDARPVHRGSPRRCPGLRRRVAVGIDPAGGLELHDGPA